MTTPKPYQVGAPYIYGGDAPSAHMIVICTYESGKGRYLSLNYGRRWPHELDLEHALPLGLYGVMATVNEDGFHTEQVGPSSATYQDGDMQRWQAHQKESLPFKAPEPKRWRLDSKLLRKFAKWIKKHPNQIA
jgi:hypothetical protein